MRGVHILEKPCYREIRVMRGRAMRGLPVLLNANRAEITGVTTSKVNSLE